MSDYQSCFGTLFLLLVGTFGTISKPYIFAVHSSRLVLIVCLHVDLCSLNACEVHCMLL